ncbi:hypothetical protein [Crocosphaera sp. Alani8]|uniref:hypothetical protein n=1 Tax=Crocosphaera sp. Alani8 TaxID=3038952 RepID=UPI00313E9B0F
MNYKGYGQASIDSEFLLDDADIRVRLDLGTQGNYEQTVMNAWGTSEATPGNNFRVDLDSGVGTSLNALPEVPRPVVDFPINYTFPTLADDILSPINSISVSGNFKESIISEDVSSLTFIDFTGEPSGRFINYELPENTLIPDNYSNFFTTARHLTFFYTADVWYYSLEAPYYRVSKRFGFDSSTVDGSRDDILNTNDYVFSADYPSNDKPEQLGFTTLNLSSIGTEEEELNISYVDIFHTEYALQNNIANRDKGGTEHRSSAYHRTGSGNYIFRGHPLPFSMEAVGGEIDNLYVDQPRRYTRIKSPTILNNGKTSFIYYNYIFKQDDETRLNSFLGRDISYEYYLVLLRDEGNLVVKITDLADLSRFELAQFSLTKKYSTLVGNTIYTVKNDVSQDNSNLEKSLSTKTTINVNTYKIDLETGVINKIETKKHTVFPLKKEARIFSASFF